MNTFEIDDEIPSAVDIGPPGASWCMAMGTEKGNIHIVEANKKLITIENPTKKDCRVFSLSFSPVLNKDSKKPTESSCLPPSFLASIHERPDGELLRIHKLACDIKAGLCIYTHSLHTYLSISDLGVQNVHPKNNLVVKSRFKHCTFLNWHRPSNSSASARRALLVATVIPISVNSHFFSQLVVYCVEYDNNQQKPAWLVTMLRLPKGQLPSCLVTHPSCNTALIGMGTIDGDVSVYQFLPQKQCLVETFRVGKAHSIFVTDLAFLPSRERSKSGNLLKRSKKQSVEEEETNWSASSLYYEFVTVSADRNLCWHSGPSFVQIAENINRQDDYLTCSSIKTIDMLSHLFCLLFIMFAPLFIASMDKLLSFF
ncbi:hypothetical protein Ciccas_004210 [Cichlidogyrus casuarinus]|uniref:Uncharacterized protein n=1 Tax=Cichlidogyrus casuarinus TaxID=1844966 RepID=A0ABD2QC49_9PLAT